MEQCAESRVFRDGQICIITTSLTNIGVLVIVVTCVMIRCAKWMNLVYILIWFTFLKIHDVGHVLIVCPVVL